ncbi:MAG: hypothetical protein LC790_11295 [Actinobacteria bacterium]|nr:hypothetical protein [Actinomycetota bacterium]
MLHVEITGTKTRPIISWSRNDDAIHTLDRETFGRTLLLTDRHEWTDEQIISAYHGLNRNEKAIRQLKNTDYICTRPIHHWTDQKIRVHLFCCVLALLLGNDLYRRTHSHTQLPSPERTLDQVAGMRLVQMIYHTGKRGRPTLRWALAEPTAQQSDLLTALDLNPHDLTNAKG